MVLEYIKPCLSLISLIFFSVGLVIWSMCMPGTHIVDTLMDMDPQVQNFSNSRANMTFPVAFYVYLVLFLERKYSKFYVISLYFRFLH